MTRGPWWDRVVGLLGQVVDLDGDCTSVSVASVEAVRDEMTAAAIAQLNEGLRKPTVRGSASLVEIWDASHVSRTGEVVLVLLAKPHRESTLTARVERRIRLVRSSQAGRLVARWT